MRERERERDEDSFMCADVEEEHARMFPIKFCRVYDDSPSTKRSYFLQVLQTLLFGMMMITVMMVMVRR